MRNSVKGRLAITFILVMVAALAAIGALSYFLLGDYYLSRKTDALEESFRMLNESGFEPDSDTFVNYCAVNSLSYVYTNSYLNNVISNTQDSDAMAGRLLGKVLSMDEEDSEVLESGDSYEIVRNDDRFVGLEYLELWGVVNDGDYYLVRCPLQSIDDAAMISFRFFLIIAIIVVIASVFVILIITDRTTKPLRELTQLSMRMADLDFNAKYESGGKDEIGQLGENFNQMSNKLETTISDLKSANLALQQDIEEKQKIDDMRREFLSNVSHELKTPIALIQGYAEGLKDNISEDQESRDFYCDVIIDESNKMNHLVRRLLDLNHLESGNEQLSMQRFDLTELITGVLDASFILIGQKGANVLFDREQSYYVWGDEFKIEQVITNYLTNALNHLGGKKEIEITLKEEEGRVTTTVFNTGSPIPEDSIDRIWDKFYKVDKARTREYGGSGIGLSIVQAIMEAHNGTYGVMNYENGVAFFFTLESK